MYFIVVTTPPDLIDPKANKELKCQKCQNNNVKNEKKLYSIVMTNLPGLIDPKANKELKCQKRKKENVKN